MTFSLYVLFYAAVIFVVLLVVLGGISVWTRDEHPPVWQPPQPSNVKKLPGAYDWQREDDEWLERFLEDHDS